MHRKLRTHSKRDGGYDRWMEGAEERSELAVFSYKLAVLSNVLQLMCSIMGPISNIKGTTHATECRRLSGSGAGVLAG